MNETLARRPRCEAGGAGPEPRRGDQETSGEALDRARRPDGGRARAPSGAGSRRASTCVSPTPTPRSRRRPGMTIPDMFAMLWRGLFPRRRAAGDRAPPRRGPGRARHRRRRLYAPRDPRRGSREAGISVWLRADLDVLMRRVRKRHNRPLLQNPDPEGTMRRLIEAAPPDLCARRRDRRFARDPARDRSCRDALLGIDAVAFGAAPVSALKPRAGEERRRARPSGVPLGGRAYDILVGRGLLDGAGPRIAALGARAAAIVSDETVAAALRASRSRPASRLAGCAPRS